MPKYQIPCQTTMAETSAIGKIKAFNCSLSAVVASSPLAAERDAQQVAQVVSRRVSKIIEFLLQHMNENISHLIQCWTNPVTRFLMFRCGRMVTTFARYSDILSSNPH